MPPIVQILLLSLVAGLGTGIGGLIAIIRSPGRNLFGFLMGITAGVMLSLSFLELVNEAWELAGCWTATIGFATGALFMLLVDYLAPHIRFGELETRRLETSDLASLARTAFIQPLSSSQLLAQHRRRRGFGHAFWHKAPRERNLSLVRAGLLLAVGITIHNIPEGIAVGAGYMHLPEFGFFIAAAILLHNIPEGIGTALPLYTGGVNKWVAFRVALISGLAEPVGALAAAIFLSLFHALVPAALAFAGGVMVFITLDEMIPAAREHGHQHTTAVGIILGSIFVFLLSGLLVV